MFGLYYTKFGPKVLSGDKSNIVLGSVLDGNIRFTDILLNTGLSKSTVNFILKNLTEEGYIFPLGEGRARTYRSIVLRALYFNDEHYERKVPSGEDIEKLTSNIEKYLLDYSIGSLRAAGASLWPVLSEMAKFMGPAAYASLTDWTFSNVIDSMTGYFSRAHIAKVTPIPEDKGMGFTYVLDTRRSPAMRELLSHFVKDFILTYISSFLGHRCTVSEFTGDGSNYTLRLISTEYDNPFRSRLEFKLEKVEEVPELPAIVGVSTHIEVVANMSMVRILRYLGGRRLTVAQISEELDIPGPTVFKYMSIMKSLGVIASDGRKYNEVYWRDLPDIFPWRMPETQDFDFREISMRAWEYPEKFSETAIDFILTYMYALGFDLSQFLSRTGKVTAMSIYEHYSESSVAELLEVMNSDPSNRLEFRIVSEDPLTVERESKRPLASPVANGLRMFYNNFFATLLEQYSGCRASIKRSHVSGEGNTKHQIVFDLSEVTYE